MSRTDTDTGIPPPPRQPGARRATIGTLALGTALVAGAIVLSVVPGGWLAGVDEPALASVWAGDIRLTWWQLALMFGAASVFVAHLEVNNETHTFSLSEVPLILGLLFARPEDLIAGRMVGEALVLGVYVRQSAGKLGFNLSVFFAETSLAIFVHSLLAPTDGVLGAAACAAAFLSAAVAGQLGATAVWGVIRVHEGDERLLGSLVVAGVTTVANACLAIVAAVLAVMAPWALLPLLAVCVVIVSAYRGYARLSRRYGGLRTLYEFTRNTAGTAREGETTAQLLAEARRLMRAGLTVAVVRDASGTWTATSSRPAPPAGIGPRPEPPSLPSWLRDHVIAGNTVLIPDGDRDPRHIALLAHLGVPDLVAAPMIAGDQIAGVLVAAARLGDVSTFDTDDELLLATLASQAAVALQNAGLIEQLHEQIQAREFDALHDSLTGLPNRALFLRCLEAQVRRSADPDGTGAGSAVGSGRTAVLLMDLNGFKDVNDTLGHRTGDRLLEEVADRLSSAVPQDATVARLGGDEFAIVLPEPEGDRHPTETFLQLANDLSAMLRQPFTLDELTLEVGASVGVAVAPDHGDDPTTLLQRADVAMYTAKSAHQPAALYDPEADWHTQDRLRLAHELRRAIESRQITVAYQPIARAGDGRVTDVEALARWDHTDLGSIGPDTFIPVAERTGLVHELTWDVLDQVLTQARIWRSAGLELVANVNLSVQLLRDRDLPRKIAELLARHRVPASVLRLEITENGIMTEPGSMIGLLEDLVRTGVTLAIDDFGTGQSSLAYLQRLPVSQVKIDKSLVLPMSKDANARTIVRSVIELAHNLELQTVAEGVEDRRSLELLAGFGCDFIQGYHLSRPIPAVEITEWLVGAAAWRGDPENPSTLLRPVRRKADG